MDQEKDYITLVEILSKELKRMSNEKDMYKSLWEQAESTIRKMKEAEQDVRGVQTDAV